MLCIQYILLYTSKIKYITTEICSNESAPNRSKSKSELTLKKELSN